MRFVLKVIAGCLALLIVAAIGLAADIGLNRRRLLYTMLGRDTLVAACLPPLTDKLRAAGFEPSDVEFSGMPDIAFSTFAGRRLEDDFTFADGASQTRVDGTMACSVKGGTATVEVQTDATPTRAT